MKLFVILSRVPFPLEKGDKLRAYHQLKELHPRHEIHLCCLTFRKPQAATLNEVRKVCTHLSIVRLNPLLVPLYLFLTFFTRKPFQVGYFFQLRALAKVRKLIAGFRPDHIYAQLLRTAEYVKDLHDYRKTIDYQDAFSAGAFRRASGSMFLKAAVIRSEGNRLRAYERVIFDYFDCHTIISTQDREAIDHPRRKEIRVIPNGVDTRRFYPTELPPATDLLFTGNMSYPPNVESAVYLVREIMPLVWKENPEVILTLAGATPAARVKSLAGPRVRVTGWLPDLNEAYNTTRIFIAPMQIGAGLQNKLLEAMACRIACITSELANNALGAEDQLQVLVGQDPGDYKDKILLLLQDEAKRNEIAVNGFVFVKQKYSWEHACLELEKCFQPGQ